LVKKRKAVLLFVLILVVAAAGLAGAQVRAKQDYYNHKTYDPEASRWAAQLSCMFPGTGEWYNRDFRGSFPVGECMFGYMCPLIGFSSFIDAAAGDTSDKMRFNFWGRTNNN